MAGKTEHGSAIAPSCPEIVDVSEWKRFTVEAEVFEPAGEDGLATRIVRRKRPAADQIAEEGDHRVAIDMGLQVVSQRFHKVRVYFLTC